jgi:hypothetical protein
VQPSLAGFLVCAALLLFGRAVGGGLLVALIASTAFGSTALVILSSLGGSSPVISTAFVLILLGTLLVTPGAWRMITRVFRENPAAWVVLSLLVYAAASALIMPRLFAGDATAFVVSRERGITEVPLTPNAGNITQTGYFVFGALAFFAVRVLLFKADRLTAIRTGFLAWATLNAVFGLVDLAGKMTGAGDLLLPIRTANFAFLIDTEQGGFWRIAGAYPEASAFGAAALASLAFAYTYWRRTGHRGALALAAVLLLLSLLSTSSTAYAGLVVMGAVAGGTFLRHLLADRLTATDLMLVGLGALTVTIVLALVLQDGPAYQALDQLIRTTVLDKSSSASAVERGYWNQRSLAAVFDTAGLGLGMGSSRASSWLIAVISQLGIAGTVLIGLLVAEFARPAHRRPWVNPDSGVIALHDSIRSATLAGLLCGTIASGSADPGLLFFVGLATLLACRSLLGAVPPRPVFRSVVLT